jgi:cob(I)alamin adenosyltransferase
MECVGNLDELRAHTALLRLQILSEGPPDANVLAEFLQWLLDACFVIGAECSDPERKHPEYRKAELAPEHIARLEKEQARLETLVRLPHSFIASAANPLAAQADITCTVARRFERSVVRLTETVPIFRGGSILVFVNRLSDYLYMLARFLDQGRYIVLDYSQFTAGT